MDNKEVRIRAGLKDKLQQLLGYRTSFDFFMLSEISTLSVLMQAGIATDKQKQQILMIGRANPTGSSDPVEVSDDWEVKKEQILSAVSAISSLERYLVETREDYSFEELQNIVDDLPLEPAGMHGYIKNITG